MKKQKTDGSAKFMRTEEQVTVLTQAATDQHNTTSSGQHTANSTTQMGSVSEAQHPRSPSAEVPPPAKKHKNLVLQEPHKEKRGGSSAGHSNAHTKAGLANTTLKAANKKASASATEEAGGNKAHKASATAEAGGNKAQKASTTAEAGGNKAHKASTTAEAGGNKAHKANTTAEAGGNKAHKASSTAEAGGNKAHEANSMAEAGVIKAHKASTTAEAGGIKAHKASTTAEAGGNTAHKANSTAEAGSKSAMVVDSTSAKTGKNTAEEVDTADTEGATPNRMAKHANGKPEASVSENSLQHAAGKNAVTKGGKAEHHTTSAPNPSMRDIMSRFELEIMGEMDSRDTSITNMQKDIARLETANNDHVSTHKTLRLAYKANQVALLHAETQLLHTSQQMSAQQTSLTETEAGMVECQKQLALSQNELANEQKKRSNLQMQKEALSFDVDQLRTRVSVSEEENKRNRQKLQKKNSESNADAAHYARVKLESADTLGTLVSQVQRHLSDIEKNDEKQARILTFLGEKHSHSAAAASLPPSTQP